ncbi:SDR family NAD(P)-dependent oxidoreductase [Wenyingzhuangia aestuarii]|uniref:SDR family NAD(P)-dependent oxidoreductase n=1 Tax=Wenyingzhuangia aestuarii TaxID=1647582 RepID=UPI00143C1BF8|nr:SDR family oxidoreductase [Wenyingzhuangia aestuarii]NJB83792.1 short-subunit dehydrogenase [Wenyingzhuangia aestuarii]
MNKTVLITGTSRGIGFELAQLFANNNYSVLAISRNTNTLEAINHPNIKTFGVDLSQENEIDSLVNYIAKNNIQIEGLVHNAGKLVNKPFAEISQEDFKEVYQVNVFSVALLTQKIIPFMPQNSHVVTISSMGGIQGSLKFPGLAAYSSSKGAVITLSELLAEEYKEQKIAFNVLALGAVQTEMLQEAFPGYEAPIKPSEMAKYIFDFTTTGNKFYNGKVLEVSSTTP